MYSPLSPQASLSSELRQIINERNMLSMRSRMKGITSPGTFLKCRFSATHMYISCKCIYHQLPALYCNILLVLHALNEDNERHAEEREKSLRSQAIREILTTEVTYLQQLEILAKVSFKYQLTAIVTTH